MLLTVGSALGILCRSAIQLGSLYESHVVPDASSQTSAFNGRSIPTVCTDCINGVPPRALPKIMSSVGRNARPASRARESLLPVGPSFPLVGTCSECSSTLPCLSEQDLRHHALVFVLQQM